MSDNAEIPAGVYPAYDPAFTYPADGTDPDEVLHPVLTWRGMRGWTRRDAAYKDWLERRAADRRALAALMLPPFRPDGYPCPACGGAADARAPKLRHCRPGQCALEDEHGAGEHLHVICRTCRAVTAMQCKAPIAVTPHPDEEHTP